MSRLYNLAVLLFLSSTCLGQQIDSTQDQINFEDELSLATKLELLAEGGLVTSFLNNSLVANDHWNDEIISNQINALGGLNRFGGFINFKALYHSGTGLYYGAGYQNMLGGSVEKPILQAVLEGNQNQPLIAIDRKNGFQQIGYAYASIGKAFVDSIGKRQVSIGLNLYSRQSYSKVSATSGEFSLDSAGEVVTVSGADIEVTQDLSNAFNTFGLGFNFSWKQVVNRSLFSLRVENLGVFFGSTIRTAQIISDFTFDGFNLSSQINNAGSVSLQDSVNQRYFNTDTSSATQLIPFTTSVGIAKQVGETNTIEAEIKYIYFAGYLPLLNASYHQRFKGKKASWNIGARVGGFGNYGLTFGTHLPISDAHLVTLKVSGLESMASQNLPVNWFARVGMRFIL